MCCFREKYRQFHIVKGNSDLCDRYVARGRVLFIADSNFYQYGYFRKKGLEKEWKTWHNKIDEKHSMKGIKAENGTV